MDLEPGYKVHNLVVIQINNTKLGQMTNLEVVFHMVVSIYKLDKICYPAQSPAQPQSGQYLQAQAARHVWWCCLLGT